MIDREAAAGIVGQRIDGTQCRIGIDAVRGGDDGAARRILRRGAARQRDVGRRLVHVDDVDGEGLVEDMRAVGDPHLDLRANARLIRSPAARW